MIVQCVQWLLIGTLTVVSECLKTLDVFAVNPVNAKGEFFFGRLATLHR